MGGVGDFCRGVKNDIIAERRHYDERRFGEISETGRG